MSRISNNSQLIKVVQHLLFCFFAFFSLVFISFTSLATTLNTHDIDKLISHSIKIRSSDSEQFKLNLALLAENENLLSTSQWEEFLYLQAYKLGIEGDFIQSILLHKKVEHSSNINVRVRSLKTQLNLQFFLNHFDQSNGLVDKLLAELPNATNLKLKNGVLRVIAYYYNHIEEYSLALNYAELIDSKLLSNRDKCIINQLKLLILLGLNKIKANSQSIVHNIDFCYGVKEIITGNSLLLEQARYLNQEKEHTQALEVLTAQKAQILTSTFATHHQVLFSQLSQAYLGLNQLDLAKEYGEKSLAFLTDKEKSKWALQTYLTLAKIAEHQGNSEQAISYLFSYQKIKKTINSIEQQKAYARAQIEHTVFGKKQYREKLATDLKTITTQSLQASDKIDEYEQGFSNNRIIFAAQLGIIFLLGFSLLYFRHLQISTDDINKVDPLTGLYNRRHFIDLAVSTISRQIQQKQDLAVIVVNIDGFREFNQKHGIISGDQLLVALARLLKRHVASLDNIGRIGADEFVLVLPRNTIDSAMLVAEKIQLQIANLANALGMADGSITASIGVSDNNLSEYSLKYLMCDTSKALIKAKQNGGAQVYCFDSSMTEREKFKVKDHGLKYYFEQAENIRS
ncbi:diguanylate cyclase [Thalassotalea sp. ND16A]|uniref:diguanylate cyclase n=1 Tax=Thalassotalea sp. ND16A TaxID=1535422 RepID=UPI00051A0AF1|nr:diguanylate cyclase [Thalassotalea sp. ND16A]KGJ89404.1 putative diguanylate cyclase [Thalassotalea sp. ND16A]